MENFLIGIERSNNGYYYANFSSGSSVELNATNYTDAVLEADLLTEEDLATA